MVSVLVDVIAVGKKDGVKTVKTWDILCLYEFYSQITFHITLQDNIKHIPTNEFTKL